MFRNQKSNTISRVDRALTLVMLIAGIAILSPSCKKSGNDNGGSGKRISDVVPPAYQETVTSHGMPIYEGDTPPTIVGKFKLSPYRFDYDNHSEPGTGRTPGEVLSDLIIQFSEQDGQDLKVAFGGNYLSGIELRSPFVTGSGNNFTACFQATMFGGMGGLFTYPYTFLFSGTLDGSTVKNMKMAVVGLGETNQYGFTVAGEVTLYSDSDGTTEQVP